MLFLMFCSTIYAQNIQIFGKIISTDSIPVPNASITNDKTGAGTTSDKDGLFKFTVPMQKTTLSFSHVSYNEKKIILNETTLQDAKEQGVLYIDVVMEKRVRELVPVTITDSKVEIAWENPKQWILDYELVGEDELLLLLVEKNKTHLQLGNDKQKSISKIVVGNAYEELFKDCFETIHLLSTDSTCQVFLSNANLILAYQASRKDFDAFIFPSVINSDNYLYTKVLSRHNQLITYNKINKETKNSDIFVTNYQEEQSYFNASYVGTIVAKFVECNPHATPNSIAAFRFALVNSKDMAEFIGTFNMLGDVDATCVVHICSFYKNILEKPPYSMLAKINDSIFFFDHLNNKIQKFDIDGNHVSDKEISYHKAKGWAKEIIINKEHTRCFAKFVNDGITTLREINPNTGELMGEIVLKRHVFLSNIKVRGDYIYYLCRDYYKDNDKYFLWKQRMED